MVASSKRREEPSGDEPLLEGRDLREDAKKRDDFPPYFPLELQKFLDRIYKVPFLCVHASDSKTDFTTVFAVA